MRDERYDCDRQDAWKRIDRLRNGRQGDGAVTGRHAHSRRNECPERRTSLFMSSAPHVSFPVGPEDRGGEVFTTPCGWGGGNRISTEIDRTNLRPLRFVVRRPPVLTSRRDGFGDSIAALPPIPHRYPYGGRVHLPSSRGRPIFEHGYQLRYTRPVRCTQSTDDVATTSNADYVAKCAVIAYTHTARYIIYFTRKIFHLNRYVLLYDNEQIFNRQIIQILLFHSPTILYCTIRR